MEYVYLSKLVILMENYLITAAEHVWACDYRVEYRRWMGGLMNRWVWVWVDGRTDGQRQAEKQTDKQTWTQADRQDREIDKEIDRPKWLPCDNPSPSMSLSPLWWTDTTISEPSFMSSFSLCSSLISSVVSLPGKLLPPLSSKLFLRIPLLDPLDNAENLRQIDVLLPAWLLRRYSPELSSVSKGIRYADNFLNLDVFLSSGLQSVEQWRKQKQSLEPKLSCILLKCCSEAVLCMCTEVAASSLWFRCYIKV